MPRSALLAIGALVILGGIVAFVLFGKGKSSEGGAGGTSTSSTGTSSNGTGASGTAGGGAAPSLPQTGEAASDHADQGSNPRDYVVGDIRVRDHRAGDNKPLDVPPNVHPAEGPSIPSTLTHEISQKVKEVVYACAKDLPKDARGEKPRLEGQISIAIKDGNVTINKSSMVLRDVPEGPAGAAMKSCVESKSVGLTNPAPDQTDLADYTINLSYALP